MINKTQFNNLILGGVRSSTLWFTDAVNLISMRFPLLIIKSECLVFMYTYGLIIKRELMSLCVWM